MTFALSVSFISQLVELSGIKKDESLNILGQLNLPRLVLKSDYGPDMINQSVQLLSTKSLFCTERSVCPEIQHRLPFADGTVYAILAASTLDNIAG